MNSFVALGMSNTDALMQASLGVAVITAILGHELPAKLVGMRTHEIDSWTFFKRSASMLCHCIPEMLGLGTVLTMAVLLRLRGDTEVLTDPREIQAWEEIKREWPILMGADTLLNLQAMLRLLVLLFLALRANWSNEGRSPLAGTSAAFFLAAMCTRGALANQTRDYRLEGPLALGGDLPIACEAAMIPFLALLSADALRSVPIASVTAVALATAFSKCHYLNFASDGNTDSLFILAHLLELLSALAFLVRTITAVLTPGGFKGSPSIGFIQFLMPVQSALSAYYWLTAIEPRPEYVGRGRPFCVIIMAGLIQLAVFLCSAALYFGSYFDSLRPQANEIHAAPFPLEETADLQEA